MSYAIRRGAIDEWPFDDFGGFITLNKKILVFTVIVAMVTMVVGCKSTGETAIEGTTTGSEISTTEVAPETTTEAEVEPTTSADGLYAFDTKPLEAAITELGENLKNLKTADEINDALTRVDTDLITTAYTYYATADKQFYLNPATELPADYDATQAPWYLAAVEYGLFISDTALDETQGSVIITISKKVEKDGVFVGVVGVDFIIDQKPPTTTAQ